MRLRRVTLNTYIIKYKFGARYKFGNSLVYVIPPSPPPSEEEKEKILNEMHRIGWQIIREMNERGEVI